MIDVFYFTKATVRMSNIASIVSEMGHHSEVIESNNVKQLNVYLPMDQLLNWMPIEPLGEDFSSFESPQQERIRAYEPMSGFIVSYHVPFTKDINMVLGKILERFGGWIGLDDNTFERIYDIENFDSFAR